MNDKELLELAAKAAGMNEWKWNGLGMSKMLDPSNPEKTGSIGNDWNPLTDDGEALRLAVKLNVDVVFDFDRVMAVYGNGYSKEEYFYELPEPTDRYAATRRAIVRAAAEIGKEMK